VAVRKGEKEEIKKMRPERGEILDDSNGSQERLNKRCEKE
jgi:hypothetical protein